MSKYKLIESMGRSPMTSDERRQAFEQWARKAFVGDDHHVDTALVAARHTFETFIAPLIDALEQYSVFCEITNKYPEVAKHALAAFDKKLGEK